MVLPSPLAYPHFEKEQIEHLRSLVHNLFRIFILLALDSFAPQPLNNPAASTTVVLIAKTFSTY